MDLQLSKIINAQVFEDPFPHIVVDDFFDEPLFLNLANEFPSVDLINQLYRGSLSAHRKDISSLDILKQPALFSESTREVTMFFNSENFLKALFSLFNPYLSSDFLLSNFNSRGSSIRFTQEDHLRTNAISSDFQIGFNSSKYPGLSPHLDDPAEVFAGLYYINKPHVIGSGGDLVLYQINQSNTINGNQFDNPFSIKPTKIIRYKNNRLVFFLNGPLSVHSVTPWVGDDHYSVRRLFNVVVEAYNLNYKSYSYKDHSRSLYVLYRDLILSIPKFLKKFIGAYLYKKKYTRSEIFSELDPLRILSIKNYFKSF